MTPVLCSERMPPIVHTDQERISAKVLFLLADDNGRGPCWCYGHWDERRNCWEDVATSVGDEIITYSPDEVTMWCAPPPAEVTRDTEPPPQDELETQPMNDPPAPQLADEDAEECCG